MAKSKNHTNHNQSTSNYNVDSNTDLFLCLDFKAHRNGIKKVKAQRFPSLRGVWLFMLVDHAIICIFV